MAGRLDAAFFVLRAGLRCEPEGACYDSSMTSPATDEHPGRSHFLDLCILYGDFNRPVFLAAFLQSFLGSASPDELKSLRRAIRDRGKALRRNRSKGRPRTGQSWNWICSTLKLIWEHDINRRSWREIASAAGIKSTEHTTRAFQKRRDHYAMLIWEALPGRIEQPGELGRMLNSRPVQRLLRSRLALPFDTHPQECRKIVLALAPRGQEICLNELTRIANRPFPAKTAAPQSPRK